MSQMRKDVYRGRWVIVADTNAVHPLPFRVKPFQRDSAFCPFCETNEASTPPEVFAIRRPGSRANGPGWSVRVVPNSHPQLGIEGDLGRRGEGFHDLMNGIGAHEIIVETPGHDRGLHELEPGEILEVLRAYVARITDLEQDKRMRYVLVFKNHGEGAGAHTIFHSISQLMGLPVTPRNIKTKLIMARNYYIQKERCLYCDVLRQELDSNQRLVAENTDFVAFTPFASRFPFEICVLPKSHNSAFSRISASEMGNLAHILRDVLRELDSTLGQLSYNLSLQDRPFVRPRKDYWETIEADFHWHLEILPQVAKITGFEWASGFFYNPVPPEIAARCLASSRTAWSDSPA
jgi:UDPglucose--hexose-1-phosphate uridylyltransferase